MVEEVTLPNGQKILLDMSNMSNDEVIEFASPQDSKGEVIQVSDRIVTTEEVTIKGHIFTLEMDLKKEPEPLTFKAEQAPARRTRSKCCQLINYGDHDQIWPE